MRGKTAGFKPACLRGRAARKKKSLRATGTQALIAHADGMGGCGKDRAAYQVLRSGCASVLNTTPSKSSVLAGANSR